MSTAHLPIDLDRRRRVTGRHIMEGAGWLVYEMKSSIVPRQYSGEL